VLSGRGGAPVRAQSLLLLRSFGLPAGRPVRLPAGAYALRRRRLGGGGGGVGTGNIILQLQRRTTPKPQPYNNNNISAIRQ